MATGNDSRMLPMPRWLVSLLGTLNWDIFHWKVYVGANLTLVFDWLLLLIEGIVVRLVGNINQLVVWSTSVAAWTSAIGASLQGLISFVYNEIAPRISSLTAWVENLDARISDLTDKAVLPLWALVGQLSKKLTGTMAWVSGFSRFTLPLLMPYSWFFTWWGRGGLTFDSWLNVERAEVLRSLEAEMEPVRRKVKEHDNIFEWAWDFLTDPMLFLYKRGDEFFERFW